MPKGKKADHPYTAFRNETRFTRLSKARKLDLLVDHLRNAPSPCINRFYAKSDRKARKACSCLQFLNGDDQSKEYIQKVLTEIENELNEPETS